MVSPPHEAIPSPPPQNSRVETRAALVGALGWVCHRGGGLKRKREKSVLEKYSETPESVPESVPLPSPSLSELLTPS